MENVPNERVDEPLPWLGTQTSSSGAEPISADPINPVPADETPVVSKPLMLKYFLHGIAFSLIMVGLVIIWAVLLVMLIMIGSVLGLFIGIAAFLFSIGGLNVILTNEIWHVEVKSDWKNVLAHGTVLFIALILVGIPSIVLRAVFPGTIISIVLFIPYCFIDGYVARKISGMWVKGYQSKGLFW